MAANFEFYMVSRRPGRYLKTFLEPVASFSQSMSPFRAMATPFMPEITKYHRTPISRITDFPNLFSFFDFLVGTLSGLDPRQKIHIDCPQLQTGVCGGSISHQRLFLVGSISHQRLFLVGDAMAMASNVLRSFVMCCAVS